MRRGVLLQITAGSLVTGSRSRALARSLVADGIAHVLASDAHGSPAPRPALLDAGVAEARAPAGAYADWIVEEVPAAILAGEALPPAPAVERPRRRRLRDRLRPRRA